MSVCVSFASAAYGQRFGNEWINYSQTYFKVSVAQDGIYKLDYNTLLQAGFPVNSVDPRRVQLFFRGKEQAITLQGQQDARFDAQDYIVFYGQRNDGAGETNLYITPEAQPHPYYNLYSDTASYFLTWRLDGTNGKRMASFAENNVSGLPAEAYHLEEKLLLLTSDYALGRQYPIGSSLNNHLSDFDYAEGWTGPRIQQGSSVDYTLSADKQYVAGPKPQLEILLTGRNNQQHKVAVQIGSSNSTLRPLEDASFSYYDIASITQTIEWSDISNGQLTVRITPQGIDGRADNVSVSYIKLTYPQATDASQENSKVLQLTSSVQGKSFISVAGAPQSPVLLDITSQDEVGNIGFSQTNGKLNAVVPNTGVARKLFLGAYQSNMVVKKVTFSKVNTAANFLMISHAQMQLAAGQYADPVSAYASYRSSAAGGGYTTQVVTMQQLIDQFSYGDISPLAIRHFADYMLTQGNPEYLLLIGKGLTVNYNYYRTDPTLATVHDYVMTGGMPGSDVLLTAGLAESGVHETIPTGRIAARNAAEVAAYLDKVKEQESRPLAMDYNASSTREALWKKRLVHLSGGVTVNELKLFSIYVDQFKDQATGNYLGGRVSTLSKTTNNATELINIADEVNKGLALITFFGHSSIIRTDIEIGYVSNTELGYHNKGKYPTILVNGCNAGNIYSNTLTFGEDWIATPDKGALNVLAHSAEGLSNMLKLYSGSFYETAFEDSAFIDASLGHIKKETDKRFIELFSGTANEVHTTNVQQMVLQGDPAVRLFGRSKIDYGTSNNNLSVASLTDQPVTAYSDSFAIDVIVRNYGTVTSDSLRVSVNRTLTNGKVISYGPVAFPAIAYEDTLQFVIKDSQDDLPKAEAYGINRFEVVLDSPDSLDELSDNNNRATLEYNMPLGGTVNLLPYNYAMANQANVLLQVQPGNLQGALEEQQRRTFLFEADTSAAFDSPVKQTFSKEAVSLATWPLTLPVVADSTVYYWRTKFAEPREGEIDAWSQHSFTYIGNSGKGWAQIQPAQLQQNSLSQLSNDHGWWSFEETSIAIDMTTYGGNETVSYPQLSISGKQFLFSTVSAIKCRDNSINGVAFEKESLRPYLGIPPNGFDDLDPNNCGPLPQVVNTLSNQQVNTKGMLETYIDGVKEGDAVLIFTIGTAEFESWQAVTLEKLADIGVAPVEVTGLQNGEPLIILGRKGGAPGSATVLRAAPDGGLPVTEQQISLQENISSRYSSGTIFSRRIGPASSWVSLQHRLTDIESTDEVTLQVVAESLSGVQTILYEDIAGTPNVDISQVDAAQYPYLHLKLFATDKTNLTPVQLEKWLAVYTGVPEGVTLMPANQSTRRNLQEGQSEEAIFSFYNIADVAFSDSLTVSICL